MTNDKNGVATKICADIKYVCKTYGNRNAGSEGEKLTSEYFYDELSACSDEIKKEEFKLNPNAFTGWLALSVSCFLLGVVAYFFSSLVSLLLFIVGLLPFILEYVLYLRTLDPLYAEKTSQNITAIKKCSDETKKRLYFVANIDAPFENSFKYRFGGMMLILLIIADLLGVAYFMALSIARWVFVGGVGASIVSGYMLYFGLAGLVFVLPMFASYFMKSNKVVVNGANNNLTGCFVASRVLGALKDVQLKNTEVGVILTGGGACGLRGAKAWCDAHSGEVDKENTVFISLYSLRELGSLNVTSTEMNGLAKSDKETSKLVLDCAKELNIKCANHRIPFESSDSGAFTQSGFKSAGICAINLKLPEYYATRYDSYDNLSEECIGECYALALEVVRKFSEEQIQTADGENQHNSEISADFANGDSQNVEANNHENETV